MSLLLQPYLKACFAELQAGGRLEAMLNVPHVQYAFFHAASQMSSRRAEADLAVESSDIATDDLDEDGESGGSSGEE